MSPLRTSELQIESRKGKLSWSGGGDLFGGEEGRMSSILSCNSIIKYNSFGRRAGVLPVKKGNG